MRRLGTVLLLALGSMTGISLPSPVSAQVSVTQGEEGSNVAAGPLVATPRTGDHSHEADSPATDPRAAGPEAVGDATFIPQSPNRFVSRVVLQRSPFAKACELRLREERSATAKGGAAAKPQTVLVLLAPMGASDEQIQEALGIAGGVLAERFDGAQAILQAVPMPLSLDVLGEGQTPSLYQPPSLSLQEWTRSSALDAQPPSWSPSLELPPGDSRGPGEAKWAILPGDAGNPGTAPASENAGPALSTISEPPSVSIGPTDTASVENNKNPLAWLAFLFSGKVSPPPGSSETLVLQDDSRKDSSETAGLFASWFESKNRTFESHDRTEPFERVDPLENSEDSAAVVPTGFAIWEPHRPADGGMSGSHQDQSEDREKLISLAESPVFDPGEAERGRSALDFGKWFRPEGNAPRPRSETRRAARNVSVAGARSTQRSGEKKGLFAKRVGSDDRVRNGSRLSDAYLNSEPSLADRQMEQAMLNDIFHGSAVSSEAHLEPMSPVNWDENVLADLDSLTAPRARPKHVPASSPDGSTDSRFLDLPSEIEPYKPADLPEVTSTLSDISRDEKEDSPFLEVPAPIF